MYTQTTLKTLFCLLTLFLCAACERENMNENTIKKFIHEPSKSFAMSLNFEGPQITNFKVNNIILTVSLGRKSDNTKIVYLTLYSREKGNFLHVKEVTMPSLNPIKSQMISRDIQIKDNYNGIYRSDFRLLEDIDFSNIPNETKSIPIELTFTIDSKEKTKTFNLEPVYYKPPIR